MVFEVIDSSAAEAKSRRYNSSSSYRVEVGSESCCLEVVVVTCNGGVAKVVWGYSPIRTHHSNNRVLGKRKQKYSTEQSRGMKVLPAVRSETGYTFLLGLSSVPESCFP